ncbi:hypothetical protein B5S31_g2399 [[Candida] boidinii]|nr:hypothetical protein B5S31_g2399 [[Candida] boidinii]OWB79264.1 hypothetical protein B5S32_g3479 [[Candida] boidinii]
MLLRSTIKSQLKGSYKLSPSPLISAPFALSSRQFISNPPNLTRRDQRASADPAESADATATILADTMDFTKRIQPNNDKLPNKATWWDALCEKEKHTAAGKQLDSYSYQSVGPTAVSERTPDDSFSYLSLPFKDDVWLRDSYINAAGRLRVGQLFQDLDALAGVVGYRHCYPSTPVNVTASVDRVYMVKKVDEIHKYNFVIAGSVTWTGRSSMEISVKGYAYEGELPKSITKKVLQDQADKCFLTANFTFVARNPETHKAFPINHLLPTTEAEWIEFKRAESHNIAKKLRAKMDSLDKVPPTEAESKMIHNLYTTGKIMKKNADIPPKNLVLMKDTTISSTLFMQPQYRNRHSYMIFGGYLLRQTFELAYCAAGNFSRANPRFVSLDTTTFKAPVPVGSVLFMDASICYTEHIHEKDEDSPSMTNLNSLIPDYDTSANRISSDEHEFLSTPGTLVQVKVDTKIRSLSDDKLKESGTFVYSFYVPRDGSGQFDKPGYCSVLPQTYSEMMDYLEGRRRAIDTAKYADQIRIGQHD